MTARLVLLVLALAALPVLAQSRGAALEAAPKYHQGARLYVDGELEPAEAAVRAGLRLAPDDRKLQELLDLILQDQDNQDGDQNQDDEGDSGDDGQDGDPSSDSQGESGDGESSDESDADGDGRPDGPDETERDGTDQGQDDPDTPDDGQPPGARPGEGGDTPQAETQGAAGQMSRAQAERLLDAVGGEEELMMQQLQRSRTRVRRGDKDW